MKWPSLYVACVDGTPAAVGVSSSSLRRRVRERLGCEDDRIALTEVPLLEAVKVLRIPAGEVPLPGAVAAIGPAADPADERVAPARAGDPETAKRAAAAARRLGGNRRTEILRFMAGRPDRGWTESEITEAFGGVAGGTSKRLGELIAGAWAYADGERPSITTGTPQRVVYPTHGGLQWVAANPREAS